jgi:putrescine aminotransferase
LTIHRYCIHGHQHPALQKNAAIWKRASGCTYYDVNDEEYLDGISGLYNVSIGHGRKEMAQVAYDQLNTLDFVKNMVGTSHIKVVQCAKKLVSIAQQSFPDMESAYFCCGGSEANEAAIHLALRYWEQKNMKSKRKIIAFNDCYHGSSFISASVNPQVTSYGWDRFTGKSGSRNDVFLNIDFPSSGTMEFHSIKEGESMGQAAARQLEQTILDAGEDTVAAFLFEPIQGDAGCTIPHNDFWPLAKKICDKYQVLMISDEVLMFGKTGRWWSLSHFNVSPDIITVSKGISSAYAPLGAAIISKEIKRVCIEEPSEENFWMHDYTNSGHPLCCAIGLKNLEIMEDEGLMERSSRLGPLWLAQLMDAVSNFDIVQEVRGIGFIFAVQFKEKIGQDIEDMLLHEEKIVTNHSGNNLSISYAPSLIMSDEEWTRIVDATARTIQKYMNK